jgi:hypothetical protein
VPRRKCRRLGGAAAASITRGRPSGCGLCLLARLQIDLVEPVSALCRSDWLANPFATWGACRKARARVDVTRSLFWGAGANAYSPPAAWQNQIENCNDRQRHQRDENEALGLRNILQRHPLHPTVVMTHTCARLKRRRHDQWNLINPNGLIAILSDQSASRRFVTRATQGSGMIKRVLKPHRENADAAAAPRS